MKPHLRKIHLDFQHSFEVRNDSIPHFYNKWQFHPELELVHIIKGSGRQFIGDNVHHFKTGDMILLGSNLPHLWKTDEQFLQNNSMLNSEAIVIHFLPDCFGESFFSLPENLELKRLLHTAAQAVRVKGQTKETVALLMKRLLNAKSGERIILLLQILNEIAGSKETKVVCSTDLAFQHNRTETERFNNIYQYILKNFSRPITLEQVARVAHISPHSFCRYFKSRMKKTYSTFLMEVRIGHACKLLAETHKSVAEICYECGFNSFSNFNRHFKTITSRTPLAHRNYYQEVWRDEGK